MLARSIEQLGGELDAADGVGAEELAACGKRGGGAGNGCDFVGGGDVPPAGDSDTELPDGRAARLGRPLSAVPTFTPAAWAADWSV